MRPSPKRLLTLAVVSALVCGAGAVPFGWAAAASGQDRPRGEADVLEGEEEEVLDQEVDTDLRREGAEQVKVFRFSGLDVAGRLKSPQLLYFLNRMRAEFDRPRLPHRSFIPELQRSAQGKAFR